MCVADVFRKRKILFQYFFLFASLLSQQSLKYEKKNILKLTKCNQFHCFYFKKSWFSESVFVLYSAPEINSSFDYIIRGANISKWKWNLFISFSFLLRLNNNYLLVYTSLQHPFKHKLNVYLQKIRLSWKLPINVHCTLTHIK